MKAFLRVAAVFLIGAVAGGGPFACMTYLPSLLTPGVEHLPLNWEALLVVSGLVAVVTVSLTRLPLPSVITTRKRSRSRGAGPSM